VQNFAFPDTAARQPYESGLKPLFKWLTTAEKHKGSVIKGGTANDCSPDAPKAVPMEFSSSRGTLPQQNATTTATIAHAANQTSREASHANPLVIRFVTARLYVHVSWLWLASGWGCRGGVIRKRAAGKRGRHSRFGILTHVGRKSGTVYRTPVNVFRAPEGYQLSLPTIVHDPTRRRFPIFVLRLIGADDFMQLSTFRGQGAAS
jgi:hypothetical protein